MAEDVSFSIRVIDDNGNGLPNRSVGVRQSMDFSSEWEETDDDGWACFSIDCGPRQRFHGWVSIAGAGDEWYDLTADDGDTFSFTV
jgi:hypothetical protein